jgi:hypothetical protein
MPFARVANDRREVQTEPETDCIIINANQWIIKYMYFQVYIINREAYT